MKINITSALIEKLISLRDGKWIPASRLKGLWVEELLSEGVIISKSQGTRRMLYAPDGSAFCRALSMIDESLANLEHIYELLQTKDHNRSAQATATGNSKLIAMRSCPGFLFNSFQPIVCALNAKEFVVAPQEGSMIFVTDWQQFSIPTDVVVVGIENMENFRMIRKQRALFEHSIGKDPLLFVSRYPQSSDLRKWLQMIPNRYVHFGDFDLAGINIFLTEFHVHLPGRASFLIPDDIEKRLQKGSNQRYQNQYQHFHNLQTDIPSLQHLIHLIHTLHRCYDQEGYIEDAPYDNY